VSAASDRARFEQLLDRAEASRSPRVSFGELRELGRLYQLHAALLARLRDAGEDPEELHHLNALCVRGYALLYAGAPVGGGRLGLGDLLARTWRVQVAAWALLAAGIALGASLVASDPRALFSLVPATLGYTPEMLERLWESPEARTEFLAGNDVHWAENAFFGSSLFAHNTRVGILSGVPTALLQIYNGVILGALSAVFFRDAPPIAYLAWILPHGVPELLALTLCAAAGLLLGTAVAAPGRIGRGAALREVLQPVVLLVGLAAPLFAAAALTESFVRESTLGTGARLGVAAAWIAAGAAFLLWTRWLGRRDANDASWIRELEI